MAGLVEGRAGHPRRAPGGSHPRLRRVPNRRMGAGDRRRVPGALPERAEVSDSCPGKDAHRGGPQAGGRGAERPHVCPLQCG